MSMNGSVTKLKTQKKSYYLFEYLTFEYIFFKILLLLLAAVLMKVVEVLTLFLDLSQDKADKTRNICFLSSVMKDRDRRTGSFQLMSSQCLECRQRAENYLFSGLT